MQQAENLSQEELKDAIRQHELAIGLWTEVVFKDFETEDPEFWAMESLIGSGVREVLHTGSTGLLSLYRYLFDQKKSHR